MTVNKNHIMEVPNEIDMIEAGGLPEAWITSFQLIRYVKEKLESSQCNILVHGVASGVGTALVQQLKQKYNTKIIGVCGTEDKERAVKK